MAIGTGTSEDSVDQAPRLPTLRYAPLLAIFVVASFASAGLLFSVQPMFTKMVLPRLGGAASVWSVAMVFFQATLLAGYAYAHFLTSLVSSRIWMLVHVAVMIAACFALPLHVAAGWGRPPSSGEAPWLFGLFAASIGLPFFALSANAPLLQAWFARTDHPAAKDPYFLYAAGNLGSLLALVSYPLAIEPMIRLGRQTWLWSIGYCALIFLMAACGALLRRSASLTSAPAIAAEDAATPTWRDAARWVGLAAVPSGLLLAVTAHISTDVAAVPLLWVLPLALYLLTFIIVFQSRPLIPHRLVVDVQPVLVLGLAAIFIANPQWMIGELIIIHMAVFFVSALMCHGELARRRPPARHLTAFYMWISVGGMIGGISAGLIAPHVFDWVMEYPLLLALAMLCRPGPWMPASPGARHALLAAAALMLIGLTVYQARAGDELFYIVMGALLGVALQFWQAPPAMAAIIAYALLGNHYFNKGDGLFTRNFFGVLSVQESSDGRFRVLWDDTTAHGAQRLLDGDGNPVTGRPEMLSEYFDGSAMAQAIDMVRERAGGSISYGVIGLGTGTLACRSQPGDKLDYYEINPGMVRIARDPKLFGFLSECKPDARIILGDARLTIADTPDESYDLLFVDAFLSHAIPVHLITREAMAIYLRKVKPHGIVVFHVSNPYLELASVVAGIAEANGAVARINDGSNVEPDENEHKYPAVVVAVARNDADFGPLADSDSWPIIRHNPKERVWSDDYSNVVGALLRNSWN